MKIEILEYHGTRGNRVKVQSHNKIKGKWVVNPLFEFHKKVSRGETTIMWGIFKDSVKSYFVERK